MLSAGCDVLRKYALHAARSTRHAALLGLVGFGAVGCTDYAGYDLDAAWGTIPALSTMRGSVAYDPYELPRLPASGSVPIATSGVEILPQFSQAQLDSVGRALTNPVPASPEVLALGQQVYETQCSVCHGPQGAGNGSVVGPGKYPFAPAINGPETSARSDGYIYGVIRVGRGLMPAYGERIHHNERWAVVNYVRVLQRQGGGAAQAPVGAAAPAAPAAAAPANSVAPAGAPGAVDTLPSAR